MKHLPDSSLLVLLKTFNDIWETGNVPKSWKEATIIPIPKPGKDNTNPNNYRPIALTSCIGKALERMINERLVWYLETNNIITEFQSGFRHQRSTNDHLVRLKTFIREDFIKKEHLVAVFFDLEKATCLRNCCEPGCRLWCLWWCLFVLSFFPRGVLGEILNLFESVSEEFPSCSRL